MRRVGRRRWEWGFGGGWEELEGTRCGEPRSSVIYDFCRAEAHEKFYTGELVGWKGKAWQVHRLGLGLFSGVMRSCSGSVSLQYNIS